MTWEDVSRASPKPADRIFTLFVEYDRKKRTEALASDIEELTMLPQGLADCLSGSRGI